jgi:hypothetical protein
MGIKVTLKRTIQREGIDLDPLIPWNWANMTGKVEPVEIVSYPIPGTVLTDDDDTIMVRLQIGNPCTLTEIRISQLSCCYHPSRHPWWTRTRWQYGDDPSAFQWSDERDARIAEDVRVVEERRALGIVEQEDDDE